jgi:hypothetical protein
MLSLSLLYSGLDAVKFDEGAESDDENCKRLKKCGPPGTNEYQPLILNKGTVSLWLKFKFVEFVSKRMDVLRALKKRRLNESSGTQVGADIGKILESKAGADCKIKTSCGQVFDVHRCILAGKRNESKWFC